MRKLWIRRKAVSTMIGGIIVLSLFLVALVAMILVSQQYDVYQGTVNKMSQKDIDRFSEDLQVPYPGVSWPPAETGVSCAGGNPSCDRFTLAINNLAGIGTQIARIYINSTKAGTLCSGPCVLDPATGSTNSTFRVSDSLINPSETNHVVDFWFASNRFDNETKTFSLVTTRGRIFSFTWPIPATKGANPTGSLYLGCLAINFDNLLVTYTSANHNTPPTPLAGGWLFPGSTNLIFYVRVSNICTDYVKLLDKSTFYGIQYTGAGTGASVAFYLAAPMSEGYHDQYFSSSWYIPTTRGNTYPGNTADGLAGNNVWGYNQTSADQPPGNCVNTITDLGGTPSNNPCYILPPAGKKGEQSLPTYLLFSATDPCYKSKPTCSGGQTQGNNFQGVIGGTYVIFLAMYWQCMGVGGGDATCSPNYEFGVTLPFITIQTCDPANKKLPYCT